MNRKLIIACSVAGTLVLGSCAGMSDTEQRTLTGAGIGTVAGVAVGAITGDWWWAAAGAAAGAATGYLVDRNKQAQQQAYERGVQTGKQQATTTPPK
jgi:outer membrane lipoprotein SlyB